MTEKNHCILFSAKYHQLKELRFQAIRNFVYGTLSASELKEVKELAEQASWQSHAQSAVDFTVLG